MDIEQPSFEYYSEKFLNAFYHSFNKFLDPEARTEILNFLIHNITSITMYLSFTPGDITTMSDMVFKHSNVRDFCFMLASSFYARIDQDGTQWLTLCERLAGSYALDSHDGQAPEGSVATPWVVASRLPNLSSIRNYLFNNKWLVVLAMIDQVISLADIQKMAPEAMPRRIVSNPPIIGNG